MNAFKHFSNACKTLPSKIEHKNEIARKTEDFLIFRAIFLTLQFSFTFPILSHSTQNITHFRRFLPLPIQFHPFPPFSTFLRFPCQLTIALSSILQQLFNAADTAVAGRFGSPDALAAVGTNGEIVALIVGLSAGLAVGANVRIAHFIGAGEQKKIPDVVHTGMLFSVLYGVLFGALGQLISKPLLMLIHTPADILTSADNYLRIYFAGVPFLMIYNFGAAILRAKGDSKRPLGALIFSGVINVFLNLFFVVVCKLSVVGVALATDLSTAVSAAMVVFWLLREHEEFRLSLRKLKLNRQHLQAILRIGIPAAIQSAVFCIANIFVQSAINTFGSAAAAGVAVSMNFEYIAYYMDTAFGQAATTFISQNYAAGNRQRCKKTVGICFLAATLFSAAIIVPVVLFSRQASGLFTTSSEEITYACERIRIILGLQVICSCYEIPAWSMRGLGYSTLPAAETMLGICAVRILWLFTVFARFGTLKSLYFSFPSTWVITSTMILITFFVVWRKAFRSRPSVQCG